MSEPSMSLRDWIAGQALVAAFGTYLLAEGAADPKHKEAIADASYAIADAMLAARGPTK